jgi:hypothetical protein
MADFFSNLAGLVLGLGVDVQPRLPPRFAPWPDLSLTSPLAQPLEPVGKPASADMPLFPPSLIAPGHPASDMPLPTFRQLSQVGTGPVPFIQPDLPSMPEAMPETADAEPGDIQQYVAPPLVPAADGSRPEPTMAMPPIDVDQTREALPAPPAQPVVQEQAGGATDVAPGQAIQPADAPVTRLLLAPALEPAMAPEPGPVLQQAGPAQGHPAPATSPLQPASHTQPGDLVPLGYSSPGLARPPADTPVTPLVPAPALEPPTAPEPAPVLQPAGPAQDHPAPATSPLQPASHTQPGYSSPGPANPPAGAPVTPLVPAPALEPPTAPEPAPVLQPAGPAQDHPAPATSPLQPASHSQPGDLVPLGYSSPSQARPPADALVTPLVPAPALEPRVAPEPVPVLQPASPAQGHPAPATSPLQPASHSQPGDLVPLGYSSPGQARNQKAAVQAGRRVDAPPAQPSPQAKPPGGLRNGDGRAGSRIWPGPAEPAIVPAPEAPVADGWPLTAVRPAWSWQRPALPPPPEPPLTVRVTIGRVEVRLAPPEPPPSVQPRQPLRLALSLDEYLKGGEP